MGLLNLEFCEDGELALAAFDRLAAYGKGHVGVMLDVAAGEMLDIIVERGARRPDVVVLTAAADQLLAGAIERLHAGPIPAFVVVTDSEEAAAAVAAGADALIAKGHEAGGWVGDETSFVLLQRLLSQFQVPVWAYGGVGLHTIAACSVAGAAGAMLDSQLLLARESPLPAAVRDRIALMDGSETACLGSSFGCDFRIYIRPGLRVADELRKIDDQLTVEDLPAAEKAARWREAVRSLVGWHDPEGVALAVGQDAAMAQPLASRFKTVGGILSGLRESLDRHCAAAQAVQPLAEGGPLAVSHGTRYPIVQGPMTRVSDRAQFAEAVASAGALPFLALALMRAPEVRELLRETTDLMGDKPWGVGILGFVPAELRAEQMEVIRAFPPKFVLIAGGRPDQARALENDGIPTYLHVPSPGLLDMFLKDGARRFVFEGRECGGHTGPRTSFVLWESMVEVLLQAIAAGADASQFHVLFAGGIHDGLSAAMVSAVAAPLAEAGVRIGVLVGTAYLFTTEAVASGAITPGFQQVAVACERTALLESGPGQTTRCAPSPFVDDFEAERRRLMQEGLSPEELKNALEMLNIGRLRIASKGVDHNPAHDADPSLPRLVQVDPEQQWARGMYMIGQVANLRDRTCTLAELHRDIALGSVERLRQAVVVTVSREPEAPPAAAVAIVGMGCIMPGATDLRTFWDNILNKVDAITEIPESRWDWRRYYDPDRAAPDKTYSRWGGFVPDVPFDPVEFGMPPSSVPSIEPFQLLALLTVRAALRDAGYADRSFPRERTSVVLGAGGGGGDLTCGYITRTSLPTLFGAEGAREIAAKLDGQLPEWTEDSFAGLLMNVAAGRVANRFDFGGTNYTVDAACASSLAAVYLAVRDLENRTSDMVVVGGIDALENPFTFLCFSKTQAHSPTGRCRTFDANADGIAISEGFGAVVLKRLEDAERDGDRIYGVIRGVGGASDGRDRSLTAPRPEGQIRALRRAYAQARFEPASVGLIEAHGTGTVAGDQAEIQALTTFFDESGASTQACAVGSVKSMVGHTKATAGVAGLIKVALALYHKVLPATLGVTEPNPRANFPASPFYVNSETRPWLQPSGEPRRAGVSSFGFGGTDFHVAVEEYTGEFVPRSEPVVDAWPAELCLWRGTPEAILDDVRLLSDRLSAGARPPLADLAFTLASRTSQAPAGATLAIAAESVDDLAGKLPLAIEAIQGGAERLHLPQGVHYSRSPFAEQGKVAFLFPGQGSQYVNMLRDLAVALPESREAFEVADSVLLDKLGRPLSSWIFPVPCFSAEEAQQLEAQLTATDIAQPALGAAGLAMLRVLRDFGVAPEMAAGHSYGEFVALCAAGCFDEAVLFELSEARGRFIVEGAAGGEAGTMAAVDAPREALLELPSEINVTIANLNAPRQTVISGSHAAVAQAIEWCERRDLRARRLNVACAFHSPLVAPAQRRLAEMLGQVAFSAPRLPVYSNTTGQAYPSSPAAIASMLSDHLVQPVEFVREIEQMYHDGARVFVEVGPRNTLTSLASRILGDRPHVGVPLDQPGRPGLVQLVHGLASLASEGVAVDLARLFEHRTVSRLDLAGLDERTGRPVYSPTTWLVNGGGARPASRPQSIRNTWRVVVLEEGEEVRAAGAEPVAANGQPALPVQAGGEVLAQFELVMQQFLETQRAVMTQYLAGGTAAPLNTAAASAAPVQPVQPAIVSQPAAVEPPVEPVPEKPAP
ncbi:MAG TPA: beta-ketoacyl synthase N-terminal-like domain-containing protein, partial [Chloroflexota bacterium]|nr:beta-ketoacyl synthase N-terminal-like domain-containing protein [Chloroflexota bacterium]